MLKLSRTHITKKSDKEEEIIDGPKLELSGAEVDDGGDEDELLDVAEEIDSDEPKAKSYDARREAATIYVEKAKELFALRRGLMNQVNALDIELAKHREVLQALDPKMKHKSLADDKELRNYLKPEKMLDDKKKHKKKLDRKSEVEAVEGLLKVAGVLDSAGDLDGVLMVENVIRTFAKKEGDVPQYDVDTIKKEPRKYPEFESAAPSMSVRTCVDHPGIQMQRIGEATWQCELDKKIYNWNAGFKDYNGNTYPPAQITSVDFPNMNEQIFQTREMATSKNQK